MTAVLWQANVNGVIFGANAEKNITIFSISSPGEWYMGLRSLINTLYYNLLANKFAIIRYKCIQFYKLHSKKLFFVLC